MCIFSGPVSYVGGTRIFARSERGRQFLVYSMQYGAASDVAMVLPLPVPPRLAEDAVSFVNLERYPGFFMDMVKGFDYSRPRTLGSVTLAMPTLPVHDVGE